MTEQQTLFPDNRYDPKRARDRDLATSHEAAERIRLTAGTKIASMRLAIAAGPKTAEEAAFECARAYGGIAASYRKRTGDLKKLGLVRPNGTVRRCRITGQNAEELEVVR